MAYDSKEKQRAYARKHYAKHRDLYHTRAKAHNLRQHVLVRTFIVAAKSVPCVDCGIQYPPWVMDFDHVRGEKRSNVANMVSGAYSLKTVAAEISKCDVRCANCHRMRTHAGCVE